MSTCLPFVDKASCSRENVTSDGAKPKLGVHSELPGRPPVGLYYGYDGYNARYVLDTQYLLDESSGFSRAVFSVNLQQNMDSVCQSGGTRQ